MGKTDENTQHQPRSQTVSEQDSDQCSCQAALSCWWRCAHLKTLHFPAQTMNHPRSSLPCDCKSIPHLPHMLLQTGTHICFQAQADAQLTKALLDPVDFWFFMLWDICTLKKSCHGSRLCLSALVTLLYPKPSCLVFQLLLPHPFLTSTHEYGQCRLSGLLMLG